MGNKPAVIVARVSTDEQAATGYSLPTQLAAMRLYAAKIGRPVQDEITDDCSGAIPINERPGGKRLYTLADSGQIGAVIFFTLDRTARDERVLEYLLLKSYLHDRGVELHYTDTGLDPYTMEGNLVGYIKAHAATAERAKIAERSARGRHAKAAAGHWVGSGFTAYGYSRAGTGRQAQIMVDEREAAIVRSIFEWFTLQGLSLRAISLRLGAEGIDPPNHRRAPAQKWIPATVRGILCNELYTGRIYYGKTRMLNHKRVKVPREQWTLAVETPDLAIVDPAQFETAQERLDYNRHNLNCRNSQHEYLLRGMFTCGGCDNVMAGSFARATIKGKVYERTYYRCGRQHHIEARETCSQKGKAISCPKADTLVWNWLLDATTPENLDKGIANWRENDSRRLGSVRAILANIDKQEAKSARALARLSSALANANDEAAAALEVEINREGQKLADLKAERAKRARELAAVELTPEREAYIRAAAAAVRDRMPGADYAKKRDLLQSLNFHAKFSDDEGGRNISVMCEIGGAVLPLWLTSSPRQTGSPSPGGQSTPKYYRQWG
jgi:site-specific DNA recombinase